MQQQENRKRDQQGQFREQDKNDSNSILSSEKNINCELVKSVEAQEGIERVLGNYEKNRFKSLSRGELLTVEEYNNTLSVNNIKESQQNQAQRTNKLTVVSSKTITNNSSNVSNLTNENNLQNHIENNRSNSTTSSRGGIRVVSRNSSVERKSETNKSSIEKKSIDSYNYSNINERISLGGNKGLTKNEQKNSEMISCGLDNILNCRTSLMNARSPFTEAEETNEVIVMPNLGSMETIQSQITQYENNQENNSHENDLLIRNSSRNHRELLSDRVMKTDRSAYFIDSNNNNNRRETQKEESQSPLLVKDFYKENSQEVPALPKINDKLGHETNTVQNHQSIEKVYTHIRELMESELELKKRIYEKKCSDEMETMNLLYCTQIDTLQKVLAENQTLIEKQEKQIEKLETKCRKKDDKLTECQERLITINKYIQSTSKFTIERVNEVEKKFAVLLEELKQLGINDNSNSNSNNNKQSIMLSRCEHLELVFTAMISQTIIKYRTIECDLRQEIKEMFKKYEYYEEKIYEMDLMKHLGKENQIQNYKLIERLGRLREEMELLERGIRRDGLSRVEGVEASTVVVGDSIINIKKSELKENQKQRENKQLSELRKLLEKLEEQHEELTKGQIKNNEKLYEIEEEKQGLIKKVTLLNNELLSCNEVIYKMSKDNEELRRENEEEIKSLKLLEEQPQKEIREREERYKNTNNNDKETTRELQRLNEMIDQYDSKIEHLHNAIESLKRENDEMKLKLKEKENENYGEVKIKEYSQETKPTNSEALDGHNETIFKLTQTTSQLQHQNESLTNQLITAQQQLQQQSQTIQHYDQLLAEQQHQLEESERQLSDLEREKHEMEEALQMTEHIFDEQIEKFKATIEKLQEENEVLINEINELRESQDVWKGSNTSVQNYNLLTRSKSPKKEPLCETATMGWFKKNAKTEHSTQSNEKEKENELTNEKHNTTLINELLSPENKSKSKHYHLEHYHENEEMLSPFSLSASKDEFYYPQQNINSKKGYGETVNRVRNKDSLEQRKTNDLVLSYDEVVLNSPKHLTQLKKKVESLRDFKNGNSSTATMMNMTNKLKLLSNTLVSSNALLPLACILDSEDRLQSAQSGKYIVDSEYNTFILSKEELKTAMKLGLIQVEEFEYDNQESAEDYTEKNTKNNRQFEKEEEQNYIF